MVFESKIGGSHPALHRLMNNGEAGELCPEGRGSKVFVKFALTGDKPFIRHVLGMSHNTITIHYNYSGIIQLYIYYIFGSNGTT